MTVTRLGRSASVLAVVVGLLLMLPAFFQTSLAHSAERACQGFDVPVRLGVSTARLHGELCVPAGAAIVFLTVPGATYGSYYWDFPYRPEKYSQVRSLNEAGYATFNIDPFGTGQSDRPLSARLNAFKEANVLHQVITRLRDGRIGGTSFSKVVLMGHSLGSTLAAIEASVYRDVDGVVLTGLTHRFNAIAAADLFGIGFHPAMLDPAFVGTVFDPGYLTTRPGKRARYFHSPSDPVPEVVAVDERMKGTFPVTEVPDAALLATILPLSRRINVPVLVTVGTMDRIMCGPPIAASCATSEALRRAESPYFSPKAQLRAFALPGAGHVLTLARNTELYQRAVIDWADSFIGTG